MIPNADLLDNDHFRVAVKAEGKLDGNTTDTSAIYSANVKVRGSATAAIVASTSGKNLIVLPGSRAEVVSFNYNVKNDSMDLDSVVFNGTGIYQADIDDVEIDFDGIKPSLQYTAAADGKTLTLKFDNTLTLPVKNYKVKLFITFNNNAVEKGFNSSVKEREAEAVAIGKVSLIQTDGKVVDADKLGYSHYVAKAYPILSVKDKNTNTSSTRLDINLRKNTDNYTVTFLKLVPGNTADTGWKVVE
jgi:hypothetical protein